MDLAAIERNLEAINRIVVKINPLASIVLSGAEWIIKLARKAKLPIEPFADKIIKVRAELNELEAATSQFRAEFGTKENPRTPGQPSTGGTVI